MSVVKKKKQNINRELIIGSGVFALVFPMMFTATTFSLIGVLMGLVLLFGSATGSTTPALTMIAVYGASLGIFGFTTVLFFKRFRLLLDRKQAIQAEQIRVTHLLDTTLAEQRLADREPSVLLYDLYDIKQQKQQELD